MGRDWAQQPPPRAEDSRLPRLSGRRFPTAPNWVVGGPRAHLLFARVHFLLPCPCASTRPARIQGRFDRTFPSPPLSRFTEKESAFYEHLSQKASLDYRLTAFPSLREIAARHRNACCAPNVVTTNAGRETGTAAPCLMLVVSTSTRTECRLSLCRRALTLSLPLCETRLRVFYRRVLLIVDFGS